MLRSKPESQQLCPPATVSTVGLGSPNGQVSRKMWRTKDNEPWQNWIRKRQRPLLTLIDPLVIVINHLWRILSQSSSHITKTTLSSDLPKWSILLYGNGHCPCLYPQRLSNTYILNGSPSNAESLVWIDIKQICYCKQRSLGPCTYPGRAVPVYPAPTKITKFFLYPVSPTFIYNTPSMQINFLQIKCGSTPWNIPIPHRFNQF